MANRKNLKPEVVIEIRRLYEVRKQCMDIAKKLSVSKIGDHIGCSATTVHRISHGFPVPSIQGDDRIAIDCFTSAKRELLSRSERWTMQNLAKRFNLSVSTVFSIVSGLSYAD